MLEINTKAPDFELNVTTNQKLALHDLIGKNVILAFYPADWSPVCGDQMALYNELYPLFSKYNAELLGISVDGKWCHAAYRESRKLQFPLLSDFEPKGEISKKYGVYSEKDGRSERAIFVLDAKGIIRWTNLSPAGMNPGADGIFEALEAIIK